jgi:hypothetical protein
MIKVKLPVKYCLSKSGTALPSPSPAPGSAIFVDFNGQFLFFYSM